MATLNLDSTNFEKTIEDNDIVLIDFWASWCGPCQAFGPIFEKVSDEHNDIAFAKVDTEAQQQLAGMFQIRSIPTLAVFREKTLIFMQPGALPENALEELITKVKELDMEKVRTEMAEEAN